MARRRKKAAKRMTKKSRKYAGRFGRRGTGHIHPAGPRKCPVCGV